MQKIKSSFDQYRDGVWVHYSKLPQLTVNPKQFHQDPAGIYLFPESFETEGAWHRYPHRIHVRLKPNLKVLEVSTLQYDQIIELMDRLGFQDLTHDEYLKPDREDRNNQRRFWEILRQRFMSEPGHFNKIFRRLGYDAIFDDNRVIHSAEHQLIVLNPRKIEVISIENQKASGFEEINQVLDLVAKKLGSLGEVEIERPKKVKSWGAQNLQGSCTIQNQDKYIRVTVSPWFIQKEDQVPEALNVFIKDSGNQDRTYSVSLHFRNFKAELNKLFDPKEDLIKRVRKVFGKETVAGLLPILVPQEVGVPWPGGFDNFSGPPFGKVDYETHPMYGDPEVYLHAPSAPLKEFLRDVTPIISATTQTPYVNINNEMIDISLDDGVLFARMLSAEEWSYEIARDREEKIPYRNILYIEAVETDPQRRREGIGTKLVRSAIQAAKKLNADAIFLNAVPTEEQGIDARSLEAFYRSLGFKVWKDRGDHKVMMLEIQESDSTATLDGLLKTHFNFSDQVGIKPTEWTEGPDAPARLAKDSWGTDLGLTAALNTLEELQSQGFKFKASTEEHFDEDDEPYVKLLIHVTEGGRQVGYAGFRLDDDNKELIPTYVEVQPTYTRRGIGSGMYRYAEEHTGYKTIPAKQQSEEAVKFWAQPNRSFGSVELPEEIQKAVTRWLNGSYDTSDIRTIAKHEWPERFKTVPKRIYRGEPLREDDLERLNRGVQTAYGLSWTTKLRTAEGFAIQNDGDYGVTYWYEPKPEEVIVNLDTVMRELNLKTQYASEQEILLSRNVSLGWENVETILWSEHTEQAGEEIPRDQWEMLSEQGNQYALARKTKQPNKKQKIEFTAYMGDEAIPEEFVKLIPKTDALRNYINRDKRIDTKITVEVDGKPAGIGTLESPDIHGLYLGDTVVVQVFLAPKARGLGIGTKLMDQLQDIKDGTYSYWAGYVHHSPGFNQLAKKYGVRDMDDAGQYDEDDPNWQDDGSYDENYAEASAPTLSARERLTIARETLDEESDLMQFYYLADRESWEQSQMEDLKYEWERMDEEFREKVPAQLKFEGYDESNWIKRGKIDWDEVEDYWIRMRLKDLQEEYPTSQTYFEKAQIIHNPELVRFTKYPKGVLENGFEGHEPENLGLTVWGQRPGSGDLAFAFDKKDLKKKSDWIKMAAKYGDSAFEFTVPYAVRAYHVTDGEWQIVFDVQTVRNLKEVDLSKFQPKPKKETLLKRIPKMGAKELAEEIHRYNEGKGRASPKIEKALNDRRKELLRIAKLFEKNKT